MVSSEEKTPEVVESICLSRAQVTHLMCRLSDTCNITRQAAQDTPFKQLGYITFLSGFSSVHFGAVGHRRKEIYFQGSGFYAQIWKR